METAQEFNQRSAHVLTLGRDGASFANAIDADELQQLLLRADRLSIKVCARGGGCDVHVLYMICSMPRWSLEMVPVPHLLPTCAPGLAAHTRRLFCCLCATVPGSAPLRL